MDSGKWFSGEMEQENWGLSERSPGTQISVESLFWQAKGLLFICVMFVRQKTGSIATCPLQLCAFAFFFVPHGRQVSNWLISFSSTVSWWRSRGLVLLAKKSYLVAEMAKKSWSQVPTTVSSQESSSAQRIERVKKVKITEKTHNFPFSI